MSSRCCFIGLAALVMAVLAGCRTRFTVAPIQNPVSLPVLDSLSLGGAAVDICTDGERLVVLESSGARLLVYDAGLAGPERPAAETIPLTVRLTAPRGVAADRFYYYVYDDRALFRMSKEKLVLSSWLGNVRVAGVAGFAPGELLVSDAERGVIWYKTFFGQSREFMGKSEVREPGAMAVLPDGRFGVLCRPASLVYFNRAGIVLQTVKLAEEYEMLECDKEGRLYLARNDRPDFLVRAEELGAAPGAGAGTVGAFSQGAPRAIAVLGDRVAVLDREARVVFYRLP